MKGPVGQGPTKLRFANLGASCAQDRDSAQLLAAL